MRNCSQKRHQIELKDIVTKTTHLLAASIGPTENKKLEMVVSLDEEGSSTVRYLVVKDKREQANYFSIVNAIKHYNSI